MLIRRLTLALLLAVCVSGGFTFLLGRHLARTRAAGQTAQMYVATTRDVEAGDILKSSDVKLVAWPKTSPLSGAYYKQADVEGRAVLYPLAAGEPILEHHLAATGAGAGLPTRIPDGMRAVSLKSDQIVGVAGFLSPGTHVDVLVTLHASAGVEPLTTTVLQDVPILAAGQKLQPDPDGKATTVDVVTLLVSPEQAQLAVLASSQGNIHFVLRNSADHTSVQDKPVNLASLDPLALTPHPSAPPAMPERSRAAKTATTPAVAAHQTYHVEVMQGDKQTVENFQ